MTFLISRRLACSAGFASMALATVGIARAEEADWPTKPIELLVLNAPGGASDVFARTLAEAAKDIFSQPIVVVNKPGGGGATQMAALTAAAPDGYTIGVSVMTHFTAMQTNLAGTFAPEDFSWIALLQEDPYLLYVSTDSPYKTFADVVDAYSGQDKQIAVGGFGPIGSAANIASHLIFESAGIQQNWVSFDASSETVTNVLGGHVEIGAGNPNAVLEFVEAGRLRVLGILSAERSASLPDVPTFGELGYDANTNWANMRGIFGPKGIPPEIQQKIAEGLFAAAQTAEFQTFQNAAGIKGLTVGPAEFDAFVDEVVEVARVGLEAVGVSQ